MNIQRILVTIARVSLGLIFLVFGLNGFLNFIPMEPIEGVQAHFWAHSQPPATCFR